MWRIVVLICVLTAGTLGLSPLAAQAQVPAPTQPSQQPVAVPQPAAGGQAALQPQAPTDAVGVVVVIVNGAVSTLDFSFPGPVTMNDIGEDLKKVTRWTGWALGAPTYDNTGGANSAHVIVTGATPVQGMLDDVVWPLVAALAEHGRLGIVIWGAPVSTPSLKIENRFVTLEQSGGQGTQYYQALVKDPGFNNIEQLKRPEAPDAGTVSPRGKMALAWLLIAVASLATGVAVFLFASKAGKSGKKR